MFPPKSCDTFVVMPSATKYGRMIFGKNSDRPPREVQEIVFFDRRKFNGDEQQKCTYISIDPVANETYQIILSKPVWCWGAEMGSNEHNVCIGNEAIWHRLLSSNDSNDNNKLLGMDLVRLGLEYSRTAMEAFEVITKLLRKYGQGGQCSPLESGLFYHNSFLIADPKEALVVETVNNEFIMAKVNGRYCNISNCLTIGTRYDQISDGLKQLAIDSNLWNESDEFDFAKIFTTNDHNDRKRLDAGHQLLEEYTKGRPNTLLSINIHFHLDFNSDNNFDIKSMMKILRNKQSGICRSINDSHPTASSQVSILSDNSNSNNDQNRSIHWFTGTPDTEYSYFKPFIFHPKVKYASDKTIFKPNNNDKSIEYPIIDESIDQRHYLYRKHEEFFNRLSNSDNELHQTLRHIENVCIDELEQMFDADTASTNNSSDSNEIDNLFSDSVESELRFYR